METTYLDTSTCVFMNLGMGRDSTADVRSKYSPVKYDLGFLREEPDGTVALPHVGNPVGSVEISD